MNETLSVSMLGILLTTLIAIFSIRKTAEANRVTNIHIEMTSCLLDTTRVIHRILTLLDGIVNKVTYYSFPEHEMVETAYDRYWHEIGKLAEKLRDIIMKQTLVLPKELYDDVQKIIVELNEARELAKGVIPDKNNRYPDTSELRSIVNRAACTYRTLINHCRRYLGTDEIKAITIQAEELLMAKEESKN